MLNLASRSSMKDSTSSPVVTAVILSLDGQRYLRSQLLYYANKPIHLILADGSAVDWGNGSSGTIGAMSWEYFRYSGATTYFARLKEACSRVNTKYAFLLDDEDCTLWTGITSAIAFLEVGPDYSAAGGGVAYSARSSRRLGLVTSPRYRPFDLGQREPFDRLSTLLATRKSAHIVYQVLRTEFLTAYATSMQDVPTEIPLGFAGRSFSWFLALSGKWMSVNSPYSIRRQSPRPSASRELPNQNFTTEVANELSHRVIQALAELNRHHQKVEHIPTLGDLSEKVGSHYSQFDNRLENASMVSPGLIAKSLAPLLFDKFPSLYQRLRPNGIQAISQYVGDMDRQRTSEIILDLSALERLWNAYPQGLSKVKFADHLANN